MRTSQQGIELILEREGLRLEAYRDSVGVPTIGVGHTAGVQMGDSCTKEQAMAWLADDLAWVEGCIASKVQVPLEQFEHDALASFIFNIGEGQFTSSTLLRKLNEGDRAGAAQQFDRWHVPAEITSRRNGEREQFRGAAFVARIE